MNLKTTLLTVLLSLSIEAMSQDLVSNDYGKVKKLAEQGNATAQFTIGTMYDVGGFLKQDFSEAAKWYRKAAEQGDAAAQYNLAIMYDMGEGVSKDIVLAYAWMSAAKIFGYQGARESSDDFLPRMTEEQIQQGDKIILEMVNRITTSKKSNE